MKRIFCTNTLFIPLFVRINAVLKRRRRGKKKKTFIILWFTKEGRIQSVVSLAWENFPSQGGGNLDIPRIPRRGVYTWWMCFSTARPAKSKRTLLATKESHPRRGGGGGGGSDLVAAVDRATFNLRPSTRSSFVVDEARSRERIVSPPV